MKIGHRTPLRLAALALLIVLAVGFALAVLRRPGEAPVRLVARPVSVVKSLTPQDPQFGDTVVATLAVYADSRRVDPRSIRIRESFRPYAVTARTRTARDQGGVAVTRIETRLRCLDLGCVPPEQTAAVRFAPVRVSYRDGSRRASFVARWPVLRVHSRVAQADLARPRLRIPQTQEASAGYRLPPTVTGYSLLAASALLALGGAWILLRVALGRATAGRRRTALEQILAELAAASADGDTSRRRRALDELARALQPVDESLSSESRVLAWAPEDPRPDAISDLTMRVRAAGAR